MSDVFDIAESQSEFFRDAAVAAAHELGVFDGAPPTNRRMQLLVDVLAGFGVLESPPPRPASVPFAMTGWGALADVIRRDAPVASGEDMTPRMHAHLAAAGAVAAAELAATLATGMLVDLGGGAGTYTAAYLAASAASRATLVDAAPVIELARTHLAALGDRVTFVAGDIRDARVEGASVALLANVLHLHGPDVCAALCQAAAQMVAPGGRVVIKDLRMDCDADGRRTGPLASLIFALNMGVYTAHGDVYETARLREWLVGAGLVNVEEMRLASSPGSIVVRGTKP